MLISLGYFQRPFNVRPLSSEQEVEFSLTGLYSGERRACFIVYNPCLFTWTGPLSEQSGVLMTNRSLISLKLHLIFSQIVSYLNV